VLPEKLIRNLTAFVEIISKKRTVKDTFCVVLVRQTEAREMCIEDPDNSPIKNAWRDLG
jgi:hypothetical protein